MKAILFSLVILCAGCTTPVEDPAAEVKYRYDGERIYIEIEEEDEK